MLFLGQIGPLLFLGQIGPVLFLGQSKAEWPATSVRDWGTSVRVLRKEQETDFKREKQSVVGSLPAIGKPKNI